MGKQEARIVAIHLPTKPHTLHPVSNGGFLLHTQMRDAIR